MAKREGDYPKIPRPLWYAAKRMLCEVCGTRYGQIRATDNVDGAVFLKVKQVIDHIFPNRFCSLLLLNGNTLKNLVSCCASCHGRKLKAEHCLVRGDILGYMRELNRIGYPLQRVVEAAEHFGFEVLQLTKSPLKE